MTHVEASSAVSKAAFALLLVPVVLIDLAALDAQYLTSSQADPVSITLAVASSTVCTVPYVLMVLWLDRHEKEPVRLLAGSFLWGAFIATGVALAGLWTLSSVLVSAHAPRELVQFLTAAVGAPLLEEPAKALALVGLWIHHQRQIDGVLDGLVYGAMVGFGFAWFENVLYFIDAFEQGTAIGLATVWARGIVSGIGTHATFTAIVGAGFGLARVLRSHSLALLAPVGTLAIAIFAHAVWNSLGGLFAEGGSLAEQALVGVPTAALFLQAPFVMLLALTTRAAWHHEDQLIDAWLDEEPDAIASRADIEHLVPARRRLQRELQVLTRRGPVAWRDHRALTQALIDLAFARWHHHADGSPWHADDDPDVKALRDRVRGLRARGVTA